jgi:Sulfatase.
VPPAESSPNVLLVVMDSVRAQNCSLYGSRNQTTPFLRRDHVAELDLTPTPTFEVATIEELCDHVSPQLV